MDPVNRPICAKFEVPSFSRSWDNSDCSFGVGLRTPQSRGMGGRRGSGMVPFERAFVTSYRPSTVTFPLSLRVSEILPITCVYWFIAITYCWPVAAFRRQSSRLSGFSECVHERKAVNNDDGSRPRVVTWLLLCTKYLTGSFLGSMNRLSHLDR